jgi:F-type H+-transporting ATPase subunit b
MDERFMEINLKEFLMQVVNFVILLIILDRFVFRRIGKALKDRSDRIRNAFAEIEAQREEIGRMKAEYESKLKEADARASEIMKEALEAARAERERIIGEAKAEADRMISQARVAIEEERERAIRAIRREIADLVVLGAMRTLGNVVDDDIHRRIVADVMGRIGEIR